MHLKRQSEIAIGVLVACARKPGTTIPAQKIAQEIGTTKDHAYQVVALLVRNGFLQSERGPGGGLQLCVDPASIKLVDVLRLTEPAIEDARKSSTQPRSINNEALLDRIVETASSFLVRLLDRFTIADLVASENSSTLASRLATLDFDEQVPFQEVPGHSANGNNALDGVDPNAEREHPRS